MSRLRTLIVDDEPVARQLLKSILQDHSSVELIGESENGLDAIEAIQSQRPDLVLLDVQMPDADGFQVVEAIDVDPKPAIIFVTAFNQYAVQAFRVHALDYLLKPVDDVLLIETIDRMVSKMETPDWDDLQDRLHQFISSQSNPNPGQQWFVAKRGDRRVLVRWQDVEWLESAQNYVRAHLQNETYLIRGTLQEFEQQLAGMGFVRVHRSNIANIEKIKSLEACGHGDFQIEMQGGDTLSLSRRYRHRLEAVVGRML